MDQGTVDRSIEKPNATSVATSQVMLIVMQKLEEAKNRLSPRPPEEVLLYLHLDCRVLVSRE